MMHPLVAREVLGFKEISYRRVISAAPMNVEPRIFYTNRLLAKDRTHTVLLAGSVWKHYPIRDRMTKLMQKIHGSHHRAHPGWYNEEIAKQEKSLDRDTRAANRLQQVSSYADDVKASRICVTDTSSMRYSFQKLTEFGMGGCLVISDIPYDRQSWFREWVVEVTQSTSDEEVVSIINYWLNHEEERVARVRKSQEMIMAATTFDHHIYDLVGFCF